LFNQPNNLIDYFYLNPYTCLITLRESLVTIGVSQVEMFVTATDDGLPNRSSTINARVTINIIRNENDPFFVNTPYVTTIPETTGLGNVVITVTARDNDNFVSTARDKDNLVSTARDNANLVSTARDNANLVSTARDNVLPEIMTNVVSTTRDKDNLVTTSVPYYHTMSMCPNNIHM